MPVLSGLRVQSSSGRPSGRSFAVSRRLAGVTKRTKCVVPAMLSKIGSCLHRELNSDHVSSSLSLSWVFVPEQAHDCVACMTTIEGPKIRVPCGHDYDVACLLALVEASTRDESLFPPRCCKELIPAICFEHHMSPALSLLFSEKSAEHATPRRVYCANPTCSRFLGPRSTATPARIFTCPTPACSTRTCGRCRARVESHTPHRCGHDKAHKAVLALAGRNGWARCPTCDQMIELRSGCYHMTCVCSAQFCYRCRAVWKTCSCPRWNEGDIFAPFQDADDLNARLALRIPPALEGRHGRPRSLVRIPRPRFRPPLPRFDDDLLDIQPDIHVGQHLLQPVVSLQVVRNSGANGDHPEGPVEGSTQTPWHLTCHDLIFRGFLLRMNVGGEFGD
ncbi:hypothetical protein A0H81_02478 [Grifola frondosa]|uniref:RBR-type E3 ubiquitin transferase n=1 Tax=Grifola frondosa TaxID=5627 RepID=A0A1C7MLF9_GRIFR|nr:hypothetical protein A0H81_02478 [Grifola frondosa]